MPVYEYTAMTYAGKTTSGIIDAENPLVARQKIRAAKAFPIAIKEVSHSSAKKAPHFLAIVDRIQRVRPSEVTMMTRQLATLLAAGFPLVSAISLLLKQAYSKAFQKQLAKIKDAIVEGNSFARSLALYPRTFSPLYINMVHAGESSGTLDIVLERLADISEKQQALKHRIRSALTYPVFMTLVGMAVLFLLLTFIVPSITSIFTDMHQTLPLPTVLLINTSSFLKTYWWIFFLIFALLAIVLRSAKNTTKGRRLLDTTALSLPGLGLLIKKLAVARFARTLGSLLENGVTMLTALDIVKNIVGNDLIAQIVESAAKEVGKGQPLAAALAEHKIFPDLSIQMIQVGEQSGQLETMLTKTAQVFETEVETSIMGMTALIEPLMILIMGVAVGFIVLSICLPIFQMNQLVL